MYHMLLFSLRFESSGDSMTYLDFKRRGTFVVASEILSPIELSLALELCREADKPQEDERMEDGYTVKYLPAELLRDLNIVDTPGTNVILERQQRLTEEYVPRADMVLFTMSAGMFCTLCLHGFLSSSSLCFLVLFEICDEHGYLRVEAELKQGTALDTAGLGLLPTIPLPSHKRPCQLQYDIELGSVPS